MRFYQSPYGNIAETEQVNFERCECLNSDTSRPRLHQPYCKKAAVVVVKSVYIEEEAIRRENEEEFFIQSFEIIDEEIIVWLKTREGQMLLKKEVKERKSKLANDLDLRTEMLNNLNDQLLEVSLELEQVKTRERKFTAGQPYASHGFRSIEEALDLIAKHEVEVENLIAKVEILSDMNENIRQELEISWEDACNKAAEDLIRKYCVQSYNKTIEKFRKFALENNQYRHWDGVDGILYDQWKASNIILAANSNRNKSFNEKEAEKKKSLGQGFGHSDGIIYSSQEISSNFKQKFQESTKKDEVQKELEKQQQDENQDDLTVNEDDENEDGPKKSFAESAEYNWISTEDMSIYKNEVYDKYRKIAGPTIIYAKDETLLSKIQNYFQ